MKLTNVAGENVEKLENLCTITTGFSSFTFEYIPKRTESKDLNRHVLGIQE
jgi:hypothetical protein